LERAKSGSPSQDELPVIDAGIPRCPVHPSMGAGATCRRCGRFVCSRCSERALRADSLTCPECVALETRANLPVRLRSYGAQLIASWVTVAGFVGLAAAGLALFLDHDLATRFGVLVLLGPAVVLLLIATALYAATRKPVFGWTATLMESLMLVPLWLTSPSWCTAVLAMAPIFSAVRLLQMKELTATP
jgi:hypothetical protein